VQCYFTNPQNAKYQNEDTQITDPQNANPQIANRQNADPQIHIRNRKFT
jgi:hypothetical protein